MRARRLAIAAWAALASLLLIGSAAPTPAPASGGGVLVVGDSLEVLTIPYLQRYLPGVTLTTNAVGGYNSYQIYDLFRESYDPSQSAIVFDAGTNDNPAYPEILAGNLAKVAAQIGERCMVVPTIHGLTVNGIGNEGKNRVVRSFAASRPGTQTPDWAGAVAAHPELMQADDLHPIPAGADYRAQLIAQGVEACLASLRSGPPEATISAAPELPTVDRFARQGTALAGAIAGSLGAQLALRIASRQPLLTATLAMVSGYA
jgi:lysophospholipase L1-like esterase